jgi:hypothetical protein
MYNARSGLPSRAHHLYLYLYLCRSHSFNSTITASTTFGAMLDLPRLGSSRPPAPCMLRVKHAPMGSGLSVELRRRACRTANATWAPPAWCTKERNESRVRIDSLNAYTLYALANNSHNLSLSKLA